MITRAHIPTRKTERARESRGLEKSETPAQPTNALFANLTHISARITHIGASFQFIFLFHLQWPLGVPLNHRPSPPPPPTTTSHYTLARMFVRMCIIYVHITADRLRRELSTRQTSSSRTTHAAKTRNANKECSARAHTHTHTHTHMSRMDRWGEGEGGSWGRTRQRIVAKCSEMCVNICAAHASHCTATPHSHSTPLGRRIENHGVPAVALVMYGDVLLHRATRHIRALRSTWGQCVRVCERYENVTSLTCTHARTTRTHIQKPHIL